MTSQPRPNILVIQADQMQAAAMPFHGNPVVKAPTLARLATEGFVFDNAYCNFPLCAPSRVSMMSGQLPSRIGAYDNGSEFQASVPTFAHYLRGLGYYTCLSGKMHFVGPDQLHGFEDRVTTDIYPSDFAWTADWRKPPSPATAEMRVVRQAGRCGRSIQLDFDEEVADRAERVIFDIARRKHRLPFLLVASFTHPHDPFVISDDYWDLYEPEAIDMPRRPAATDPHSRRLRAHFGMEETGLTADQVRNARHAYYGSISYLDAKVAGLMRTLRRCDLLDDTVVVVTSDHGEFLGERGLWFKRSFFEESIRIPLVVHAPSRFAPARTSRNVSLLDLLPTFYELGAGRPLAEPAEPIDGASLVPLLEGAPVGRAGDVVHAEMLSECTTRPLLMVKDGSLKYVACETDPPQLYDLASDPDELRNRSGEPALAEAEAALAEAVRKRWDVDALTRSVLDSQRRRAFVLGALTKGRITAWDYGPPVNAAEQYYRGGLAFDVEALMRAALTAGVFTEAGGAILHEGREIGRDRAQAAAKLSAFPDIANAVVRQVHETRGFLW